MHGTFKTIKHNQRYLLLSGNELLEIPSLKMDVSLECILNISSHFVAKNPEKLDFTVPAREGDPQTYVPRCSACVLHLSSIRVTSTQTQSRLQLVFLRIRTEKFQRVGWLPHWLLTTWGATLCPPISLQWPQQAAAHEALFILAWRIPNTLTPKYFCFKTC